MENVLFLEKIQMKELSAAAVGSPCRVLRELTEGDLNRDYTCEI